MSILAEHELSIDDEQADAGHVFVARAELTLAQPDAVPLPAQPLDPDALSELVRPFQRLSDTYGDAATIAIDVRSVGPSRRRAHYRRWARAAASDSGTRHASAPQGAGLRAMLAALQLRDRDATWVRSLDRRDLVEDTRRKRDRRQSMWELQILIRCESRIRGRDVNALQSFIDAFAAYAGRNHFRVVGISERLGRGFLGSDLPLLRSWFDYRLRTGLFAPRTPAVVVHDEIRGFLKPPTARCAAPNAPRAGVMTPPPPADLPRYRGQAGVLPLGRIVTDTGIERVGMYSRDFYFGYLSGKSRHGKTELALEQLVHVATAERCGVFFIDPASDALARVKPYLADHAERIIEMDLARRGLGERHVAWNLFGMQDATEEMLSDRVQGIVDSFTVAARWERATRAVAIIRAVADTFLELSLQFTHSDKPELSPTLWSVPRLLVDEEFRDAVAARMPDRIARYWQDTYTSYPAEAAAPLLNIISRLACSPTLRATLGSPVSTYLPRRAMDDGAIVLCGPGGGREKLVSNFLVQAQIQAAHSRRDLPAEQRRLFYMWFDEAQSYDRPGGSIPEVLEQCAKYGVRLILLNQSPGRLTAETLEALGTNSSALMTTTNSYDAGRWFGAQWAGTGLMDAKRVVPRLERFTYLTQITHGHRRTEPFLVHGEAIESLFGPPPVERLAEIDQAIDAHYRPCTVRETLAQIEDHDHRVLRELAGRGRRAAARLRSTIPGGFEL